MMHNSTRSIMRSFRPLSAQGLGIIRGPRHRPWKSPAPYTTCHCNNIHLNGKLHLTVAPATAEFTRLPRKRGFVCNTPPPKLPAPFAPVTSKLQLLHVLTYSD